MKNKKGMTMVEVMVAFVILLIGLSGLYKATLFAGQQVNKAQVVKVQVDELMEGYYTGDTDLAEVKDSKTTTAKFLIEGLDERTLLPKIKGTQVKWSDYASEKGYHLQSFALAGE